MIGWEFECRQYLLGCGEGFHWEALPPSRAKCVGVHVPLDLVGGIGGGGRWCCTIYPVYSGGVGPGHRWSGT